MVAALVVLLLILGITGGTDATWCVCRSDVSDTALQKTIDYACGAGADCSAILQNGGCFQPDTVRSHCSYAANSYFQRKSQSGATCDFSGTASVTTTDPSYTSCSYPSSASTAGATTSTSTNGLTPNGLVGLGPSGSLSTDSSDGGLLPLKTGNNSIFMLITFSALLLLNHMI